MNENFKDCVLFFINLQCRLVAEFARLYPSATDHKWLLDFPKNGKLVLSENEYCFTKHGKGLRFERKNGSPHWVIDIIDNVHDPKVIDDWRILIFLESCGKNLSKTQVTSLLTDMCLSGQLHKKGNEKYRFSK